MATRSKIYFQKVKRPLLYCTLDKVKGFIFRHVSNNSTLLADFEENEIISNSIQSNTPSQASKSSSKNIEP